MKKYFGMILTLIVFVIGLSIVASAQTDRRRGINAREARQQQRIFQGIRSGELTYPEIRRLEREQFRIERVEDRYRSSGDGLSPRERARLEHALDRSSRDIYRQKHDGQDRDRLRP